VPSTACEPERLIALTGDLSRSPPSAKSWLSPRVGGRTLTFVVGKESEAVPMIAPMSPPGTVIHADEAPVGCLAGFL